MSLNYIMKIKILKCLIIFINYICIVSLNGVCHSCLWVRYKFPSKTECIYYQKNIDIVKMNCTDYKISERLLRKNL